MRKAQVMTMTDMRLGLARSVLAEEGPSYSDALSLHRRAVDVVEHLIHVGGRPAGGLRCAPEMLTAVWSLYQDEHEAKGVLVRLGGPVSGVNVHFLTWAESRLSGGSMSSNLLRLIRRTLARWRAANPGVVPEAAGIGYRAV